MTKRIILTSGMLAAVVIILITAALGTCHESSVAISDGAQARTSLLVPQNRRQRSSPRQSPSDAEPKSLDAPDPITQESPPAPRKPNVEIPVEISGTVTDAESRAPIVGAHVAYQVGANSQPYATSGADTNANGRFTLSRPTGWRREFDFAELIVSAKDYESSHLPVTVGPLAIALRPRPAVAWAVLQGSIDVSSMPSASVIQGVDEGGRYHNYWVSIGSDRSFSVYGLSAGHWRFRHFGSPTWIDVSLSEGVTSRVGLPGGQADASNLPTDQASLEKGLTQLGMQIDETRAAAPKGPPSQTLQHLLQQREALDLLGRLRVPRREVVLSGLDHVTAVRAVLRERYEWTETVVDSKARFAGLTCETWRFELLGDSTILRSTTVGVAPSAEPLALDLRQDARR